MAKKVSDPVIPLRLAGHFNPRVVQRSVRVAEDQVVMRVGDALVGKTPEEALLTLGKIGDGGLLVRSGSEILSTTTDAIAGTWTKYTVNYNDPFLGVAALTANSLLLTTAAKVILEVRCNLVTAFTHGKGAAVSASIGHSGDNAILFADQSLVSLSVYPVNRAGSVLAAATQVRIYFTCDANLNTLSAGQLEIFIHSMAAP